MNRRTARGNRLGLIIVGVLLIAAGAFALGRGFGVIPRLPGGAPVLSAPERRMANTADWFWPVAAIVAIVVLLIAVRWLFVQGRSSKIANLRVDGGSAGRTRMPARVVTRAVEQDAAEAAGVLRARATLIGSRARPGLRLDVTADERADWPRMRTDITGRVRHDLRDCLELDRLPTVVRVRMATAGGRNPDLV
ncbi:MAG TPA: alkaline shock response membrane anchor protein AmaP [Streptosporangiaceae bacterium]|jgi:hypothetical protein